MNSMCYLIATRTALVLAMAVLSAGCATIMRGPTEMLQVETQPSGATVTVSSGTGSCVSPCQLEVRRRGALTVSAEMAGCGREAINVRSRIDRFGGWVLGAYGGAALGALAYELGDDVVGTIAIAVPAHVVCVGLGVDPENCRPDPVEEDSDALYALLPVVPAAVDLGTGAVFARTPNPVRIELQCR